MKKFRNGNIVGLSFGKDYSKLVTVIEEDLEHKTIKIKDGEGFEFTLISDFINHIVRIPTEVLLSYGFEIYNEKDKIYWKEPFFLKKTGYETYLVYGWQKEKEYIGCLYQLQNIFSKNMKEFDLSDFTKNYYLKEGVPLLRQ
jgi:hypothetical protein